MLDRGKREDVFSISDLDIDFPASVKDEVDELKQELRDTHGSPGEINTPCWAINKMLAHATTWRTDRFDYGSTLNQIEPILMQLLELIGEYCGASSIRGAIDEYGNF